MAARREKPEYSGPKFRSLSPGAKRRCKPQADVQRQTPCYAQCGTLFQDPHLPAALIQLRILFPVSSEPPNDPH